MPGRANDVGVGAGGTFWAIGNNKEGGGWGIYRWDHSTRRYKKIPGSALRIDVDRTGNAWVVNKFQQIYSYNGARWIRQPGGAVDIGVGAEGTIWVMGSHKLSPG